MLFFILSLFCTLTSAFTQFDTNCTLPTEPVNYVSSPNTRGTLTILWSCLFTIFSCTWTVQHPDVPWPRENFERGYKGTIECWKAKYTPQILCFVITILAPEVLLVKYGYELWEAKHNFDRLQALAQEDGVEWTIAHSFFANMGGFVMRLNSASPGRRPLGTRLAPPHETQTILRELNTNDDDLSNSSSASRRRASMQTLTSSSNIDSSHTPVPLPVRNSIAQLSSGYSLKSMHILRLREAGLISQLPDITKEELEDRSKADWLLRSITVLQILWMGFQTSARLKASLEVTQLEVSALAFASCAFWMYLLTWNKPKKVQVPITIMQFRGEGERVFEASGLAASTMDQSQDSRPRWEVVLFFRLLSPEQGRQKLPALLRVLLGGVSFGSIHLFAWNFVFPSATEQDLWRLAALYCTVAPLILCLPYICLYLITLFIRGRGELLDVPSMTPLLLGWSLTCALMLVSFYVPARLYMLVEMFRVLAYQPPGAYIGTWTKN